MPPWRNMLVQPGWQRPSTFPDIAPNEVHVWRWDCRELRRHRRFLAVTLDPRERERAGRFVRSSDRERFTINHGILRCLLSRYTGCRPEALEFDQNAFGRPSLKEGLAAQHLDFNLSDSHSMGIMAVGSGLPVGIDIEGTRPLADRTRLAQDVFVEQELMLLEGLGDEMAEEGYFFCWTRKEAIIKAMGKGLSIPLRAFSTLPGVRMQPVGDDAWDDEGGAGGDWKVVSFSPAKRFYGALATRSYVAGITFLELPDGLFAEEESR